MKPLCQWTMSRLFRADDRGCPCHFDKYRGREHLTDCQDLAACRHSSSSIFQALAVSRSFLRAESMSAKMLFGPHRRDLTIRSQHAPIQRHTGLPCHFPEQDRGNIAWYRQSACRLSHRCDRRQRAEDISQATVNHVVMPDAACSSM